MVLSAGETFWDTDTINYIGVRQYGDDATYIDFREVYNDTSYDSSVPFQLNLDTQYYMSMRRVGSTANVTVYSDVSRTNIVANMGLALHGVPDYSHLYAFMDKKGSLLSSARSGVISNMSLGQGVLSIVSTSGINSWELTANSAILNANWVSSSNATILGFQYGSSPGSYTNNLTASGNFPSIYYNLTATNLTAGTNYFYRAMAYNGSWLYGVEYQFVTLSTVSVDTLGVNANSTYANLSGVVQALNGNVNYTIRGVQVSADNLTWGSSGKSESGNWTGTTVYLANNGIFTEQVTFLTANTTYYYRAFAGNPITGLAFGEVKIFTTLSIEQQTNVSNVQAISVNLYDTDNQTGLQAVTFNAIVNQSDTDVVLQGIQYSVVLPTVSSISLSGGIQYQVGVWNGTYDNSLYRFNPSGAIGSYSINSNYSIVAGSTIYWRAYAQNSAGLGYSSNATYFASGQTSVRILADRSVVEGNSVTLYGIYQAFSTPTKLLFSWGETAAGDTNQVEVPSQGLFSFNYTQGGLKTNTLYYWRAGVMYGGSIFWSSLPASQFTTGGTIVAVTGVADITTLPVISASSTSFNGSMSINAINSGVATQIGFYVTYQSDGSNPLRLPIAISGSYNVGTYNGTISGLAVNSLVYYAAFAVNSAGENIGQYLPVQLSASGTNPNLPVISTTPISNWVIRLAVAQGLNNPFGHWAFLLETMLFILLFFGILIICMYVKNANQTAITIIAFILLIAEVVDVLAFVFTGWLGVWPFIVAGCVVIAIVAWGMASLMNKGGGG